MTLGTSLQKIALHAAMISLGFASAAWGQAGWDVDQDAGPRPDAEVAVGPDQVVAVTNHRVRVFDKSGTLLSSTGLGAFTQGIISGDPVMLWDPHEQKFGFASLGRSVPDLGGTSVLVGMSDTDDATGSWKIWEVPFANYCTGTSYRADYPCIGVNQDAMFVSVAVVNDCQGVLNKILIIDKARLLAGLDPVVEAVEFPGGRPASITTYGTTGTQFFARATSSTNMKIMSIENALSGSATTNVADIAISPWYTVSGSMPQQGTSVVIDAQGPAGLKHGCYQTSVDRLWLCHTIRTAQFGTAHYVIRWYELDMNGWPGSAVNPSIHQSGTADFGSGIFTCYGDIVADENGNMGLVYNRSAANEYVSIGRSQRRGSHTAGQLQYTQVARAATAAQTSGASSGQLDWGDYSRIQLDPACPGRVWYHAQFEGSSPTTTYVGSFFIYSIADMNVDGIIDFSDYTDFLDAYDTMNPAADVNQDGFVDFSDYLLYVGTYDNPCGQ